MRRKDYFLLVNFAPNAYNMVPTKIEIPEVFWLHVNVINIHNFHLKNAYGREKNGPQRYLYPNLWKL